MNDLARILGLAGLATEKSVAAPADRELKEQDGCPCCGGGHCKCSGDCPDCNCHGNNEWDESVEEAVGETNAVINYEYSEDWASIDLYKDGVQVEAWDGYFGANETGNPLTAKLIELCEKHGIDPEGLKLIDGNDETLDPESGNNTGVFTNGKIQWDESVEQADEAAKPDFRDVDGDGDREESWKDAEEDKEESLDEAAAKIACLGCDEVSTAKAWEKNHGFCPKCKTSSQGVAESIEEAAMCESCNESPCTCDCDDELTESPTMDTTQLVIMMRNAGLSEETIQTKLDEWANTPEGVGEVEPTAHGDAYDFAQSVNLSLKRYLDAQDMKVQVTEHKVENMKALYEAHKAKK